MKEFVVRPITQPEPVGEPRPADDGDRGAQGPQRSCRLGMHHHGDEAECEHHEQGDDPGGLGDLAQAEVGKVVGNDRRQTSLRGDL